MNVNNSENYILAIDQGTSSTRAIVFDMQGQVVSSNQQSFPQYYPQRAWVEHDGDEIWQSVLNCCQQAISEALEQGLLELPQIKSIAITNQRETTLVWHKTTGKLIYNAIVWQDKRTVNRCQALKDNHEFSQQVTDKTGLILDCYFSASKLEWILSNVEGALEQAQAGELMFGTIDSFLLWRLTGEKVHATDATNASRTMLFNIHDQCWDDELLTSFSIPKQILPQVLNSADDFGYCDLALFSEKFSGHKVAINALVGDQQAALIGQACFEPGMVKSTYGTGAFMMVNTGNVAVKSKHKLLATVAYRLNNQVSYALEGSIFMAGDILSWLKNNLGILADVTASEAIAEQVGVDNHVYLVPAFTGLAAPYWQEQVNAVICGLTKDSNAKHIITAGLQAVAYQSKDICDAVTADGQKLTAMKVDGGMSKNLWLMQFLADMLAIDVVVADNAEATALGAFYLAAFRQGYFQTLAQIQQLSAQQSANASRLSPCINKEKRAALYQGWQQALRKVLPEI